MPDFSKAWPLATTIASAVVIVAGLVQTGFSIAKSRYELRKLRVEDEKYRSAIARQKTRREEVKPLYERSDYYYERLDYDLASLVGWIVMITFLALSGLSYIYLTRELYKNHVAIEVKKAELVVLKEANTSMGDALSVRIRSAIDCRSTRKATKMAKSQKAFPLAFLATSFQAMPKRVFGFY